MSLLPSAPRINGLWPISKILLLNILSDRISDSFAVALIWERLGYSCEQKEDSFWIAGPSTPKDWARDFPVAPQFIAQRKASIALTKSIPKEFKQLLKQELDFSGYRIGELYPRRTRRATVVNWLLSWWATTSDMGESLPKNGPLPPLSDPPIDPILGHPGDPPVE